MFSVNIFLFYISTYGNKSTDLKNQILCDKNEQPVVFTIYFQLEM